MANFNVKALFDNVRKVLQSAGVKSSAASKFIGKFSKPIAFLSAVKEGNAIVKDIPIIGDYLSWQAGVNNKIFDNTFGKIPGIGPVLTKMNAAAQRAMDAQPKARHESKARLNDPSWYTEHLGIHTNFNIPAAYPDRFPIPVAGGTPRVKSAVFKMLYNPNPDDNTSILRAEQKFALLKGVRGLSAVNYAPLDIANYEECVLACHSEYYGLKRAIQLMQRYDLMKSTWPDALVSQLGYDAKDLRTNLAQYKGYLAQCANALHELPISGNMLKKIKFMQSAVFPDSDDSTIATYYAYALKFVSAVVRVNNSTYSRISFTHNAFDHNNLLGIIMEIRRSEIYSYIIADYIGAFGSSALPAIDLDWDKPYEFTPYDENLLTQLQNTDILDFTAILMANNGMADYKPVKIAALEFDDGEYIDSDDNKSTAGTPQGFYESKFSPIRAALFQKYEKTASVTTYTAFIPPVANGPLINVNFSAGSDVILATKDKGYELSVNLPKLTSDEGLQLEYIQNKACFSQAVYHSISETESELDMYFTTMSFFCYNCTIGYTVSSGVNVNTPIFHCIMNTPLISGDSGGTIYGYLAARTLPSQCDWFPSINYIMGKLGPNETQTVKCSNTMDWNIVGILGTTAYTQAVSYTNFSLKAPAIQAGGKTIDNIQDVFNNK